MFPPISPLIYMKKIIHVWLAENKCIFHVTQVKSCNRSENYDSVYCLNFICLDFLCMFSCKLLISNNMHWKIYPCLLTPNCTQNHFVTYTYKPFSKISATDVNRVWPLFDYEFWFEMMVVHGNLRVCCIPFLGFETKIIASVAILWNSWWWCGILVRVWWVCCVHTWQIVTSSELSYNKCYCLQPS